MSQPIGAQETGQLIVTWLLDVDSRAEKHR